MIRNGPDNGGTSVNPDGDTEMGIYYGLVGQKLEELPACGGVEEVG